MNHEVSNSVYKESLTTRDLELIRHNINRNRQNTIPATPNNIAKVHEAVSSMNIVTDGKEQFLLLNDVTNNIIKNTYAVYNRSSINVGFAELMGKPLNTSFLLAPFWLKANIRNVMIYSLKLYT
jgi:hypothetical protein